MLFLSGALPLRRSPASFLASGVRPERSRACAAIEIAVCIVRMHFQQLFELRECLLGFSGVGVFHGKSMRAKASPGFTKR